MMFINFLIGLVLLLLGAEILVRGATRISAYLGISPLIIGLTVVAFGTSSPEMIVSVKAGLSGNGQIAMGNVVGSNIFNILFILGLSALVRPLKVFVQLIRWDVPIMILVTAIFFLSSLNGHFSRIEAGIFFTGLLIYLLFQILMARKEQEVLKSSGISSSIAPGKRPVVFWLLNSVYVIGGLFLLSVGSNLLIDGAISIAKILGVSQLLIGLTIVSAGTSLPEVATSLLASVRGETDIAVGNIVGSNIFNILGVSGLAGMVSMQGIIILPELSHFDMPLMLLVSVACLPIFFSGGEISRREGGLFFGYYILYILYLVFKSMDFSYLSLFNSIILWIAVPFTIILIVYETWQSVMKKDE